MTLQIEQRPSDSPYIDTVMYGHSVADGSAIHTAEMHWHMVFVREQARFHPLVVGP